MEGVQFHAEKYKLPRRNVSEAVVLVEIITRNNIRLRKQLCTTNH